MAVSRILGRFLVVLGTFLLVARIGAFPDAAYFVLYETVAVPGRLAGLGEHTAIRYFELNCRPYRYPRSVRRLITLRQHQPGVERAVFTCSDSRPWW